MKLMLQIKWKLLITYLTVAAVCMGVVIAITRELTISLYGSRMHSFGEGGAGPMMSNNMTSTLNDAFREALNNSLIWGGAAAVVVAIILSLIISRRITRPIHELAEVTGRIAEGDYTQRVVVKSRDEIGVLADSFNSMATSLSEAQKLRRELMANIAHELRTPLTSISGYMEGLVDGVVPASPETYNLVHREAARLTRLVDDLQRLSRAESGQENLDIVRLKPVDVISHVAGKLQPQFNDKGVSLEFDVEARIPALMADEDKLEQILVNLLNNGLSHTDTGGKVSILAARDRNWVLITVSDTGIGISAEDLPHVFERFFRADKSRSRDRGGTGIGLTITKHYVKALAGSISVESEPGQGTVFFLRLPAADQSTPAQGIMPDSNAGN